MSEYQPTLAKPASELRDGEEFSVDGGRTWCVCVFAQDSTVAVYLDDRRSDEAPTVRVPVERGTPVLVRADAASVRRASFDPGEFLLDLDRITTYVRVLGVEARVEMNAGGCPVILAGTSSLDEDGHEVFPAVAGPPAETMPMTINPEDLPRVVSVRAFLVGPGEPDQDRVIDCWQAGVHDEALVAYLIAAQAAAPRGTLVDDDTVARIARGEIRPGWRQEVDGPTEVGDGNWVTRYVHSDGLIVDDNTRNLPEDLRRSISTDDDAGLYDESNFVGYTRGRGGDQFPTITAAMLFAEGHD